MDLRALYSKAQDAPDDTFSVGPTAGSVNLVEVVNANTKKKKAKGGTELDSFGFQLKVLESDDENNVGITFWDNIYFSDGTSDGAQGYNKRQFKKLTEVLGVDERVLSAGAKAVTAFAIGQKFRLKSRYQKQTDEQKRNGDTPFPDHVWLPIEQPKLPGGIAVQRPI